MRFSLLILICLIIWIGWMTWEWLRNRDKTPLVPNPKKEDQQIKQENISDEETLKNRIINPNIGSNHSILY